jgi:hypothetical protein
LDLALEFAQMIVWRRNRSDGTYEFSDGWSFSEGWTDTNRNKVVRPIPGRLLGASVPHITNGFENPIGNEADPWGVLGLYNSSARSGSSHSHMLSVLAKSLATLLGARSSPAFDGGRI